MRRLLSLLVALPVLVLGYLMLPGPAEAATVWHVVAPGETAASIAHRFAVRLSDLGRWNQLAPPYRVHVDETLRLTSPDAPLGTWRSRIEPVTPASIGWNPASHCPVPPSELRKVWVSYLDLQGAYHDGSIVVRKDVAARAQNVFATLFRQRYRIMAMAPMSINMPGETDMGIVTAGWNCRRVSGTTTWSEHAYGTAIDINPLQNPMFRGAVRYRGLYADRSHYLIGMVHPDGAVKAFTDNGFHWGGAWSSRKDYMHFSTTNR